jgi:hypothetical protein
VPQRLRFVTAGGKRPPSRSLRCGKLRRRLGNYSISFDVLDTEALCGVFRRKGLCAHRSTVKPLAAESLFGTLLRAPIGRGGAME